MKVEMFTDKLSEKMVIQIERYVKLHIQPRPKWLPDFIWKKILKRLLWMQEFE